MSFDSDSTIGFHRTYLEEDQYYTAYAPEDLAALPDDITCIMSGVITYNG